MAETAYDVRDVRDIKWITKLKPNNVLVSNYVNDTFAVEAYILMVRHWSFLVNLYC